MWVVRQSSQTGMWRWRRATVCLATISGERASNLASGTHGCACWGSIKAQSRQVVAVVVFHQLAWPRNYDDDGILSGQCGNADAWSYIFFWIKVSGFLSGVRPHLFAVIRTSSNEISDAVPDDVTTPVNIGFCDHSTLLQAKLVEEKKITFISRRARRAEAATQLNTTPFFFLIIFFYWSLNGTRTFSHGGVEQAEDILPTPS